VSFRSAEELYNEFNPSQVTFRPPVPIPKKVVSKVKHPVHFNFRNEDLSSYVQEVSERQVEGTVDFSLFEVSTESWLLLFGGSPIVSVKTWPDNLQAVLLSAVDSCSWHSWRYYTSFKNVLLEVHSSFVAMYVFEMDEKCLVVHMQCFSLLPACLFIPSPTTR
jgi:hypothetical protein